MVSAGIQIRSEAHPVKTRIWQATVIGLALFLTPLAARASCSVPSSPGVVICTPGSGQTVNYPAEIKAAALGDTGLPITAIKVYVDGMAVLSDAKVNQVDDVDYGIMAGSHSLTVNAWDSGGHLFQAKEKFSVVGGNTAKCTPTTAGIRFCSPANGSYQPQSNIQTLIGAAGSGAPIVKLEAWFDGYPVATVSTNSVSFTAGGNPGTHTESAKAWDAAGHIFTASVTFDAYYDAVCSPYAGCDPGVFISSPANGSTVGSSFNLSAEVKYNPAPITAMKAYLDGKLVAESSGPTLLSSLGAGAGGHHLTVQAWDTKGNLYRTVETFTVK